MGADKDTMIVDGCNSGSIGTTAKQSQTRVTGKPFEIASYALLAMMVAQVCDLKLGEIVDTLGDAYIDSNHFDHVQAASRLSVVVHRCSIVSSI